MSQKMDIICHAFPSWRGDYVKSTVQLMKELANRHQVLYIDYAYSWKDILFNRKNNPAIPVRRILSLDNPLERIQIGRDAEMFVLSLPAIIPYNWTKNPCIFSWIQSANGFFMKFRIQAAIKKLNMSEPVVVNAFNPFFGDMSLNIKNAKAGFYYCYDNMEASPWAAKHGGRLEAAFIKRVDAVIYSSESLRQMKSRSSVNAHVVTNGVDLSNFETLISEQSLPAKHTNIHVGYVGTIDERLDYNLLEALIQQCRDWTFHFIGRITCKEADRLRVYPNVKYFGAVDVHELPGLMQSFSAGIIPFVKNEFTKTIYPMKVNEYLIMGMPVVMTDFTHIPEMEEVVKVSTPAEFTSHLQNEIESDNIEKRKRRINVATTNSWKNKSIEFEQILQGYA